MELTKREGNWVLVVENDFIKSIAIVEGCNDTQFGTLQHLVSLIYKGYYKKDRFTDQGLKAIESYLIKRKYKLEDIFK